MHNQLDHIREVLLMGPGPSCVHPRVYQALSRPTLGHLDPSFISIMDELKEHLRSLMQTDNTVTLPLSGTGSAGMEACFVNLIEPGDRVLILVNGVFSMRMVEVASRLGALVDTLEFSWGTPVDPAAVEKQLDAHSYELVAMVHAETSTGVCNPVGEVSPLVRSTDALFLVDAVTSLGGMEVAADAWGIDALYSGTQKCLSCPPGLSPVTLSDRAFTKAKNRKQKVPNWYLDITLITGYWEGSKRAYHHTAPINMIYGLYESLKLFFEEGRDAVFARHREMHELLASGLSQLGLTMFVEEPYRLPMLNAVTIPESVEDEAAVRKRLLEEFCIEIGAGLGPLTGKIWRIGLMGHTAREDAVKRLLDAFDQVLSD